MKSLGLFIFLSIFLLSGCGNSAVSTQSEAVRDEQYYSSLSNKTCGWGFHRTQDGPEFSEEQILRMTENGCLYRESTEEKTLYLTFDEGYENGYTSIILDTLRAKGVKAAFFVTGPYVKSNPDLIKRMAKEGHIIGNHTVNHPSMPSVEKIEDLKNELLGLDRLVYDTCKEKPRYLRPPKGEYSERTLAITSDMGYTNVFWSDAYVDWNDNVSAQKAHDTVTKNFHSGAVLLLHAVSKGNAEALSDIIDTAHEKGYTFKSLDYYKIPKY